MQEYVAGFMFDNYGQVALVRKNKPAWQEGKLNGIGGKVEADETPYFAMGREWREETGIDHRKWEHFVSIKGENSLVHFFSTVVLELPRFPPRNDVGEEIICAYAQSRYVYESGVPNLRWLIPLAMDLSNFRIVMPEVQ
jgi:8-oxo-dGTP diphosphatase